MQETLIRFLTALIVQRISPRRIGSFPPRKCLRGHRMALHSRMIVTVDWPLLGYLVGPANLRQPA